MNAIRIDAEWIAIPVRAENETGSVVGDAMFKVPAASLVGRMWDGFTRDADPDEVAVLLALPEWPGDQVVGGGE